MTNRKDTCFTDTARQFFASFGFSSYDQKKNAQGALFRIWAYFCLRFNACGLYHSVDFQISGTFKREKGNNHCGQDMQLLYNQWSRTKVA